MPVSTRHPEYDNRLLDWDLCRDTVEGQSAIYRRLTRYLPPPPGLIHEAGMSINDFVTKRFTGSRYAFYASFAEFPEIVSPTLNAILGLVHEKKPEVKLPSRLQYLVSRATPDGESLQELWERVTKEIVVTGRWLGLGEIVDDMILACTYPVESMINWRLQLKKDGGRPVLVVLRECTLEAGSEDIFAQEEVTRYRVLMVDPDTGLYTVRLGRDAVDGSKVQWLGVGESGEDYVEPVLYGRPLEHIPIYPINALDVGFDYGPMPLLGMARRAASIFRKSADYHRALYIKGDPQPVITGVDENDAPDEIGGGKIWVFTQPEADAKYLDIDGQGIPLMRQAIQDQFQQFADETGMLFEGSASGYESGEALRRRQAMRQVTIKSLVINAAHGMEVMLKDFARILGADPDEVTFSPNLDFTEPMMLGQELRELVMAKSLGAPISQESIHDLMKRRQLVQRDFNEELRLIEKEKPLVPQEQNLDVNPAQRGARPDEQAGNSEQPRSRPR